MDLSRPIPSFSDLTEERFNEGWRQMRSRAVGALTHFAAEPQARSAGHAPTWGWMAADVWESNDAVVVRLEAPGADAAAFDVSLLENALVISGVKTRPQGMQLRHGECAYGRFERTVLLPAPVQEEGARARYAEGVLTVTLPRSRTGFCRRIEVQGE